MSERQKLILHFVWDCLFAVFFCAFMLTRFHHYSTFILIGFCWINMLLSKIWGGNHFAPTKKDRELTTLETIAWFTIGFSALYLAMYIVYKGLPNHPAFSIPIFAIVLAGCALYLTRQLADLKHPTPVSN